MTKKRKRQKRSPRKERGQKLGKGAEPDDDSDALSDVSAMSFRGLDIDPQFKEKFSGDMQDNVDGLLEKRSLIGSDKRATIYVVISSLLSKSVWKDWAIENQRVLWHPFLDSIKRGDANERKACCKCLSLFLITLGKDELSADFSEALGEAIWTLVKDPDVCEQTPSQVAVLLSVVALLGLVNGEEKSNRKIAELLFPVWSDSEQKEEIRAGALDAWTLAIASRKMKEKGTKVFSRSLPPLVEIIEMDPNPDTLDLFIAAGRAVSLLYEAHFWMKENPVEEDEDQGEADEEQDTFNEDAFFFDLPDTDYVQDLLNGMSTQSSKGQKKETVKVQRKHFRSFSKAVEDGSAPETTVKLKGKSFEIGGWEDNTTWDFVRKVIGGGLQAHLLGNTWLQGLVGIDGSVFLHSPLKKTEKKSVQVAERRVASKEDYLNLKKARDKKFAAREIYD